MMRLAINQPFDLALSLEMGQAFRWRRVGDALVAHWDWGRPPAHWDWGRPPAHWRTGVGGWYSGVIGPRFLAPATRRPIRRPHNPPRPYPTFRRCGFRPRRDGNGVYCALSAVGPAAARRQCGNFRK